MPALSFLEIPAGNDTDSECDSFELFVRDFLEMKGFKIITGPDRGPDGGRDIIAEEERVGGLGRTRIRWLVSCKHQAHSGSSVSVNAESDIRDRLEQHGCAGFLAFYSTLPSTSLRARLDGLDAEVVVYDRERIEAELLSSPAGCSLARRYFPESMKRWERENPSAADLLVERGVLRCKACGKDLLAPEPSGITVVWTHRNQETGNSLTSVEDFYCCCKGNCDRSLRESRSERGWVDSWDDIADVMIPTVFLRWVFTPLNQLGAGWRYSDCALEGLKDLLWAAFPRVSRELTEKEKAKVKDLCSLPWYLGGLGDG